MARLGTLLLWLIIILLLAVGIAPRFLDRVYFEGPVGSHFDGERFFNPDGEDTNRPPAGRSRGGFIMRYLLGMDDRPEWPEHVAVTPARPRALPALKAGEMRVTWVGHATVLVETPGFNLLTDPIWSDYASPFPGLGPRRVAAPGIRFDDLPHIDLIVVSHNHYDHMDVPTLRRVWTRDKPMVVTSLGNDTILKDKGIGAGAPERVVALDWGTGLSSASTCEAGQPACPTFSVAVTRNHHWSSRWGVDRNRALWSSFMVDTPSGRVFFAGDTGFGNGRWAEEAGAQAGPPIRLAILPIGAFRFQPGQMGIGSHIGPGDALRVWQRLGRPYSLPIHWGTFRLSSEAYDTPPRMLAELMRCTGMDATQFTGWKIGRPTMVPPVGASKGGAVSDIARVDAAVAHCLTTEPVTALR